VKEKWGTCQISKNKFFKPTVYLYKQVPACPKIFRNIFVRKIKNVMEYLRIYPMSKWNPQN